ncbi:MAG TPA: DNA-3-methyladenine glycosylase 2 family protein [Marmoricola sp.]
MDPDACSTWRPLWPCPVAQVFAPYRHGSGDPTYRVDRDGTIWRAFGTPEGPATLRVRAVAADARVDLDAWGPGATWAVAAAPRMLGAEDDPTGFEPEHPVLRAAWRRHRHWRVGGSGLVMDSLLPAIIEQKVTGQEAFGAYARLVRRFGTRAPGPREDLWVAPGADTLRAIPSWEWLKLPVDGGRSRPILAAARVAASLERLALEGSAALDRGLRSLPGIGVWTSAEVRQRVLGDADAVSFGDFHVAKEVGWALTGEELDDDGLAEVLAPYRPHRYRVQALVSLSGSHRPRRGPRLAPRVHLPNS